MAERTKEDFEIAVINAPLRKMAKEFALHIRRDCHGLLLPIPDHIADKIPDNKVGVFFDYLHKFGLRQSRETSTYGKWGAKEDF